MYDYEWPADRGGTTPPWLANKYRDSIRALRVEQGITYIGRCAFDSCSNLSDVTLPTSLRIIGQCAFNDCTALRSIQLPEGLTTIKEDAFNAAGLVSITFPSTLRELRNGAFMNCEKLQSLRLPEGLTTIGVWAFYCNPNISSIYIPASVTTIGEEAFIYYNNLATVRYGARASGVRCLWPPMHFLMAFVTCTTSIDCHTQKQDRSHGTVLFFHIFFTGKTSGAGCGAGACTPR